MGHLIVDKAQNISIQIVRLTLSGIDSPGSRLSRMNPSAPPTSIPVPNKTVSTWSSASIPVKRPKLVLNAVNFIRAQKRTGN